MKADFTGDFSRSAFAAYTKDETLLKNSSSGGMFGTFARALLRQGGVVFGAAFDKDLHLKCTSAHSEAELKPLMKSKYLQSDMSGAFGEIKFALDSGKPVLFTATPCQIAALKNFLGKPYESLLTVDFFCHGVPSQKFFDLCVEFVEKKKKCKILSYTFREKPANTASTHNYSIEYDKNGLRRKKTRLYFHSPFYAAFHTYLTLRESCFQCPFANGDRASDITIGDFHSIDKYISGIDRFKGVSTVIVNSEKGRRFFAQCKDSLWVQEVDYTLLQQQGNCFCGSTPRPNNRDKFVQDFENMPFSHLVSRYFAARKYWKNNIFYHLPKPLRNIARHFLSGG